MTLRLYISATVACVSLAFVGVSAPAPGSQSNRNSQVSVERAIKAFLFATYSGNSVEYRTLIVPEPGGDELIDTRRHSDQELKDLRTEADSVQLSQVSPFTLNGNPLTNAGDSVPPGTKTIYLTSFRGNLLAVPVIYTNTGWKVDVRFWVAAKKQSKIPLKQTDPEVVAKQFLFYVLAKRPERLQQLSASKINPEEYTAANDLPGGDLDQILSLCLEMSIVRAREGESFRMPSGEIVRAGAEKDTLVLVGLMGTAEVAFQVKQIGDSWKVVPQRYFEMLRRNGSI